MKQATACFLLLIFGCNPAAAEVYLLASDGVRVEIEVGTDRLTAEFGPRFDRTAVVRSVSVAGVELLGPWGLPDEFGLFGDGVLGYDAAAVGEPFLKIGVGRLVRDTAESYRFDHRYPVDMLFPTEVTASTTSLAVSQGSAGGDGHAYHYRKSYDLRGAGELVIHYELSNTGAKAWSFEHYNHHWFRAAGVPVGPGYEVVTGFDLPLVESLFRHAPRSLRMQSALEPGGAAYYASDLVGVPPGANAFSVQVDGTPVVHYEAAFSPHRFALYAAADGFCPEVFMRSALEPGETVRWSATYRFRARFP